MNVLPLSPARCTGPAIERSLRRIEATFQVYLTIHDLHGCLGNPRGKSILPGRHLHAHPCCAEGRISTPGWNKQCDRDCFGAAERQAGLSEAPFLKDCYKGLRELVVPIHRENAHLMTIFAGVFKGKASTGETMPKSFRNRYAALPMANQARLRELAVVLKFFGTGLLREFDREDPGDTDARLAAIRRFIRTRAHQDVDLADLARELYLSPSRAGHLVREKTGATFSYLLEEERMRRACNLLLNTDRKLAEIAKAAGYANVFYFSRVFAAHFGLPPGQFRKRDGALPSDPGPTRS